MKEIKITINGEISAIDYCSEKYDFDLDYRLAYGFIGVESMYVNGDETENVIKKKGKYVKTRQFFNTLFSKENDCPLPVECHTRRYYNQEFEYVIELQDDEEFDIKKIQLVKSDYEIDIYPYLILAEYILYDGERIDTVTEPYYNLEEKIYNTHHVETMYS